METEFTKEYFIKKFEAIPEDKWITEVLTSSKDKECHCALGHCGVINPKILTKEAYFLDKLLTDVYYKFTDVKFAGQSVYYINDKVSDLGSTPKERILNALNLAE